MSIKSVNQTQWCVITGPPCSGKTTVVRCLEKRGYPVVHEVARGVIDEKMSAGWTLDTITADEQGFEREILLRKWEIEKKLPRSKTIFLDRALPDSVAYYQMAELNTAEPERLSKQFRYRKIFMLESLTFEKDRVRREDASKALRIAQLLSACYHRLGYAPVSVPVLPVVQRTAFILDHI
jgi:predicted ATPase